MTADGRALTLGWEEWVALPDLGLPALKAKIDTGARTSALSARLIEPFGPAAAPMVRFVVHPRPRLPELGIACAAHITGRRDVKSSNGETETRYVIATCLDIAGRRWPIEVTLSNRETMNFPMLIGRQALKNHAVVNPQAAFLQPKLGWKAYRKAPRGTLLTRPLRIAVLSRRPRSPSNRKLTQAGAGRGHVVEIIDPGGLSLVLEPGQVGLAAEQTALAHYDVVLARTRRGATVANVRQFELMGAAALNPAAALTMAGDDGAVRQVLAAAGIAYRPVGAADARRVLVVGGRAVAALPEADLPAEAIARRAASALELDVAEVVVAASGAVASISPAPSLNAFAASAATIAAAIIALAERRAGTSQS